MFDFENTYKGKVVLVTGHTGFKGSWLSIWLTMLGAKVVGYSLDPTSSRGNFLASNLEKHLFADVRGDLCDTELLETTIEKYKPEIVFHLAAQALVKQSYQSPKETYEVNVMGSINVLEAVRKFDCIKYAILITSDKCYENVEQIWGYRENDRMGGYDPYSSSKGCMELIVSSWRNSFFNPKDYGKHGKAIASVRAGNVIGGGDWSANRLIPDCIRFIEEGNDIEIRSPKATRPWEHVLEPLSGYLRLGQKLMENPVEYSDSFNFGPSITSNKNVWDVVNLVINSYGKGHAIDISNSEDVHEATLLYVDPTKAYVKLGWSSVLNLQESIDFTVNWYKESLSCKDMYNYSICQIKEYYNKGIRIWEQ